MKTKIVYVITSSNADVYLEQTYLSIYSLRRYENNATIVLLTDNRTNETLVGNRSKILEYISEKIVINFDDEFSNMKRSRFIKTSMRNLINGDFLYIDGDTIINGPLCEIDDCEYDIGAVEDAHRTLDIHYGKEKLARHANELDFKICDEQYYFNGGVFYVKDNSRTRDFFKRWHDNWLYSTTKGINLDMPALIKTNIEMGHMIKKIDGIWNCQLMYGFKYYKNAKIIHYFASRYTRDNGGYIYDFMNPAIFDGIKKSGHIDSILVNKLENPLLCFSNNLELIGGVDADILNTYVYKVIRLIYNKLPRLFDILQSILFLFNKMLKKNNE